MTSINIFAPEPIALGRTQHKMLADLVVRLCTESLRVADVGFSLVDSDPGEAARLLGKSQGLHDAAQQLLLLLRNL